MGLGIGKGLTYSTALSSAISHLPQYKGTVTGLVISGFGMGSSLYGLVSRHLVNPTDALPQTYGDESYFPPEIAQNVPEMLRKLALIYFCLQAFAVLTVTRLDSQKIEDYEETLLVTPDHEAQVSTPLRRILCHRKFLAIYFLSVFHIYSGFYLVNSFKQLGFTYGYRDSFLTLVGSCGSFCSSFAGIGGAASLDYFRFKPVYSTIVVAQITALMLLLLCASSNVLFGLAVVTIISTGDVVTSMMPTVVMTVFGLIRGQEIYSYCFSAFGFASTLGGVLVICLQARIGYSGMIIIATVFSLISWCIASSTRLERINYAKAFRRKEQI